jgi:hypothetical protein
MAKKPKTKPTEEPAGIGDNGTQREAAFHVHMQALTARRAETDRAKETLKAIRKLETQVRNAAKADGFSLKLIDEIMDDEGKTRADLAAEAEDRYWMRQARGLPVGGQMDMFATTPTLVRDATAWEAEGYRAGIRGMEGKPPEGVSSPHLQDWMTGWGAGQEKLAWSLSAKGHNPERLGHGGGPTAGEIERANDDAIDPLLA